MKKKILGILLCICGCGFFPLANSCVNNENYLSHNQSYEAYMDKYEECMENASVAVTSEIGKQYQALGQEYKAMADEAFEELRPYRREMLFWCEIGVVLIVAGVVICVKKEKTYEKENIINDVGTVHDVDSDSM